ncbi:hypothetical protein MA16_Dca004780 [Dendrobium catenatum]|uniref:Uncharacterized protein n=1 Tax=Dendrobium catenatum TaxID=906689 RepID=A0A2I0VP27_9ASPA|nr:hypothetical protein MA16_Dca004780 [Dendrobium catenatum]
MGVTQAMKRIPRIKFPQRHPKPASGSGASSQSDLKDLFKFAVTISHSRCSASEELSEKLLAVLKKSCIQHSILPSEQCSSPPAQPTPASDGGGTRGYRFRSDVPAPPTNAAIGGKASLLPKRTPVSKEEIEAISDEAPANALSYSVDCKEKSPANAIPHSIDDKEKVLDDIVPDDEDEYDDIA